MLYPYKGISLSDKKIQAIEPWKVMYKYEIHILKWNKQVWKCVILILYNSRKIKTRETIK